MWFWVLFYLDKKDSFEFFYLNFVTFELQFFYINVKDLAKQLSS